MSHTFAYAIRIGTRGNLKQDEVGLGDACLTNASEQVPPKNSSTGSTGHLQPPSWNKKNLPRANSSGTAGNRTNLQTIRVPFFHRLFTCARTYGCAVLMALLALLGVDGCCLLNYTTSVTYAFPMAISLSVIHFVIIYICRHKCDHG